MRGDKKKIYLSIVCLSLLSVSLIGSEPKIIKDQLGRYVEVPESINRIVALPIPFPSIFFAVDGSGKKIVGMHPSAIQHARNSILKILAGELTIVETQFVTREFKVNLEELLKLSPDLVVQWSMYPDEIDKIQSIGIPVVAISGSGNDPRHVEGWLRIAGQIAGKEEKVDRLLEYHYNALGMIGYRLYNIREKDKPRALVIDTEPLQARAYEWLDLTGAVNVAKDMPQWISEVNMEQIYLWDPEIIYISNFSETQPEDIIENTMPGYDWSPISAVKNKKVFKVPMGAYRWDPPSQESALMLKWLAQIHHPDLFSDYDIKEEIKEFYKRFYNYTLSDESVDRILRSPGTKRWGGW